MNTTRARRYRQIALALTWIGVAACSERPAPTSDVPDVPLVTTKAANLQDVQKARSDTDIVRAEVAAGGIPSQYRASFVENELKEISETRAAGSAAPGGGTYQFYGARLLKYTGASLTGATTAANVPIELEFDLRGALVKSRAAAGEAPADEISAIRARAQLLRSHALAQRSVHAHAAR